MAGFLSRIINQAKGIATNSLSFIAEKAAAAAHVAESHTPAALQSDPNTDATKLLDLTHKEVIESHALTMWNNQVNDESQRRERLLKVYQNLLALEKVKQAYEKTYPDRPCAIINDGQSIALSIDGEPRFSITFDHKANEATYTLLKTDGNLRTMVPKGATETNIDFAARLTYEVQTFLKEPGVSNPIDVSIHDISHAMSSPGPILNFIPKVAKEDYILAYDKERLDAFRQKFDKLVPAVAIMESPNSNLRQLFTKVCSIDENVRKEFIQRAFNGLEVYDDEMLNARMATPAMRKNFKNNLDFIKDMSEKFEFSAEEKQAIEKFEKTHEAFLVNNERIITLDPRQNSASSFISITEQQRDLSSRLLNESNVTDVQPVVSQWALTAPAISKRISEIAASLNKEDRIEFSKAGNTLREQITFLQGKMQGNEEVNDLSKQIFAHEQEKCDNLTDALVPQDPKNISSFIQRTLENSNVNPAVTSAIVAMVDYMAKQNEELRERLQNIENVTLNKKQALSAEAEAQATNEATLSDQEEQNISPVEPTAENAEQDVQQVSPAEPESVIAEQGEPAVESDVQQEFTDAIENGEATDIDFVNAEAALASNEEDQEVVDEEVEEASQTPSYP